MWLPLSSCCFSFLQCDSYFCFRLIFVLYHLCGKKRKKGTVSFSVWRDAMLALILEKVVLSAFVSLCMLTFFSFASSFSEQRNQSSFASAELLYCSVPFIVFPFFLSSLHLVNHFFFFSAHCCNAECIFVFFLGWRKDSGLYTPTPIHTHIRFDLLCLPFFFFLRWFSSVWELRCCSTLLSNTGETERRKREEKNRRNRNCHVRFVAPFSNTCYVCAFTNRIYRLEKKRRNVLPCLFSPSSSVCVLLCNLQGAFFFSLSITSQWVSRKSEKECFLCRGFFFPVTRFPCRFIFFLFSFFFF